MLYSQIILQKGMPFDLKLPTARPKSLGEMTREEIDTELQKGFDSMAGGVTYTADEVDEIMAKEFGE